MKKKLHKKNRLFSIYVYILIFTCMITALSMARYQSIYTSSGVAAIASWKIKVNNEDVTGSGTTLTNTIQLIPDENTNVVSGKLAPGYGGYFDITIDPTDTEVTFDYSVRLDNTTLPTDIEFIGYIMGTDGTSQDATEITDNTITGTMNIDNNTPFDSSDIINIRVFWMWNDVRSNDATHTAEATSGTNYTVGVEISMTQII